jgi:hypothetical protein
MNIKPLDIDYLNETFDYNPLTGDVTWKKKGPRRSVGSKAGSKGKLGYICIGMHGRIFKAHRIAFAMFHNRNPVGVIDHINGDTSDNSIENLREARLSNNQANCKTRIDNTSGIKGVHYRERNGKWVAQIQRDGKRHHLGYYKTKEEAQKARIEAAQNEYGEFAKH